MAHQTRHRACPEATYVVSSPSRLSAHVGEHPAQCGGRTQVSFAGTQSVSCSHHIVSLELGSESPSVELVLPSTAGASAQATTTKTRFMAQNLACNPGQCQPSGLGAPRCYRTPVSATNSAPRRQSRPISQFRFGLGHAHLSPRSATSVSLRVRVVPLHQFAHSPVSHRWRWASLNTRPRASASITVSLLQPAHGVQRHRRSHPSCPHWPGLDCSAQIRHEPR